MATEAETGEPMETPSNGSVSRDFVDEFEESFQTLLTSLTKVDHFVTTDGESVKTDVEQNTMKFLDLAKQLDCFFLQKRFLLSIQKPEQLLKEEFNDLRYELMRKEELIQKHNKKISYWQNLLLELQSGASGPGNNNAHQNPSIQNTTNQPVQRMQSPGHSSMLSPTSVHSPVGPQQQFRPSGPTQMTHGLHGPLAYLEKTTSNIGIPR